MINNLSEVLQREEGREVDAVSEDSKGWPLGGSMERGTQEEFGGMLSDLSSRLWYFWWHFSEGGDDIKAWRGREVRNR